MKNKLKKYREKNHLTQKQLASLSNLSLRTYQNYEQCKRTPNVQTALILSEVLGKNVADIFPIQNKL